MNITKIISPNKYNRRNSWKPDMIVCHITEGGYSGAVSWLCNPESQGSAHFVISAEGQVTQLVDLKDAAWCNGTSTDSSSRIYFKNSLNTVVQGRNTNANFYTYSIEFEGYSNKERFGALTEPQYQAGLEVMKLIIQDMKNTYGIDFIPSRDYLLGHYQIDPKGKPNCPAPSQGANFPFVRYLNDITAWKKNNIMTSITGRSVATVEQMTAYLKQVNPSVAQSVLNLLPLYLSEGAEENIRGDIAFAQSLIETGNFTFGSGTAVTFEQNNFCGMGVTGLGVKGNSYASRQMGIRAQIQHLKAYAINEPLKNSLVIPTVGESRFKYVERGCAPYVEWLGQQENPQGKGWAAGNGYGSKILNILGAILSMSTNRQTQKSETKNITVTFGTTKYILDGKELDEPTLVYNGVAYLPVAYLATKLGLAAKWDEKSNTTTLTTKK